jgi:hypothetical protein
MQTRTVTPPLHASLTLICTLMGHGRPSTESIRWSPCGKARFTTRSIARGSAASTSL